MNNFTDRFTNLFSPPSLRMRLQMLVWVAVVPVLMPNELLRKVRKELDR